MKLKTSLVTLGLLVAGTVGSYADADTAMPGAGKHYMHTKTQSHRVENRPVPRIYTSPAAEDLGKQREYEEWARRAGYVKAPQGYQQPQGQPQYNSYYGPAPQGQYGPAPQQGQYGPAPRAQYGPAPQQGGHYGQPMPQQGYYAQPTPQQNAYNSQYAQMSPQHYYHPGHTPDNTVSMDETACSECDCDYDDQGNPLTPEQKASSESFPGMGDMTRAVAFDHDDEHPQSETASWMEDTFSYSGVENHDDSE